MQPYLGGWVACEKSPAFVNDPNVSLAVRDRLESRDGSPRPKRFFPFVPTFSLFYPSQDCIMPTLHLRWMLSLLLLLGPAGFVVAQDEFVPRRQSGVPGPPLSPEQAAKKFTVPPGFSMEVVAAEPDIVNPVAMTFDEKGRIWVTESFEYPRHEAGPGRDRVKVLEDTNGDGKMDKVTIFAEGLNIPSGIAVGHGGVWVANAPDILFLEDTNGDGKADKQTVVVTGFGRTDTHELPNSLVWGPDGYLYGLNGVFNHSHVKHKGKEYKFTCAMFRIDPRNHDFELFAEGTSNPWGIAFNPEGSAFLSACVIDHLWHLTETGYYHRQGGPYPPFTWKLESIVNHKHQAAAYCGITYFDSDAYPEEYRDRLYMGNIHGGCINVDTLERDGSTYFAKPRPDFVTANDVWHMPVAQKTGPDGCLYVLDWYDRFHCYQDAMARPGEVNRDKGRLYRIRYEETPRAESFDLAQESGDQLIERLHSPNLYFRELAQQILSERADPADRSKLEALVLGSEAPRKTRLHALYALVGTGKLDTKFHQQLLRHEDPTFRAWGVRAARNMKTPAAEIAARLAELSGDESPDVQLQVAIAAAKIDAIETIPTLLSVLQQSGKDKLIPPIVWQNLHPLLETDSETFIDWMRNHGQLDHPSVAQVLPRAVDRILATRGLPPEPVAGLVHLLAQQPGSDEQLMVCLRQITERVQSREISGDRLTALRGLLEEAIKPLLTSDKPSDASYQAAMLALSWNDPAAWDVVSKVATSGDASDEKRIAALSAMITSGRDEAVKLATGMLDGSADSPEFQGQVIQALGRSQNVKVGEVLLARIDELPAELRPKAIEVLLQRPVWSDSLLTAVEQEKVDRNLLSSNQISRLAESSDEATLARITELFGQVRTGRNPDRELVVAQMRRLVMTTPGNAQNGKLVHEKLCGQCHKLHGEGFDVGPDITVNGRGNLEQLLSNVFDPSLVIGKDYQGRTVLTADGRVLSGLLVEDSPSRVVLKLQGAKLETIAREDVEEMKISEVSLMPEGVEKQLKPEEIADLFAFLTLSKGLDDAEKERIAGAMHVSPEKIHLPSTAENLLLSAEISTNVSQFDAGLRGHPADPVFDPTKGDFARKSQWHESGVGMGAGLGVVSEENAVTWQALWKEPVEVNLITLTGTYPNQPQPNTAWKIEGRIAGEWKVLDEGVGGWYDNGRYFWGWPGAVGLKVEGLRVRVFSPDDKSPIKSIHFRGEENFSWFVGNLPAEVGILRE